MINSPTSPKEEIDWLQLIRSRRVGASTFYRLITEYGTAAEGLRALPEIANAAGVKRYQIYNRQAAENEYKDGLQKGYKLLFFGNTEYPTMLAAVKDAPPVLWADGNIALLKKCIALIGARNASSLGSRMARYLARDLGEQGYTIVSGLARGIDAAAHNAAIETGTVAVLASGLDVVYPNENTELSYEISQKGLRISEQPLDLTPQARHFPQRNRIVAGLCEATIVVEGAARSGSLITARQALDYGRDVMAVPGSPLDGRASGCNILIRDGAHLVRSAEDIIQALPDIKPVSEKITTAQTNEIDETKIDSKLLRLISTAPVPEDVIIRDSGLPANMVSRHLVDLELMGRVQRQPGGLFALAS